MKLLPLSLLTFSLLSSVATAAFADDVLVNSKGMTVYTFDNDPAGKSVCNGGCAANWPPVAPTGTPGAPFSVIQRDDGSPQLAFNGKPLYLYAADKNPGDRNGDNFKNIWHVVKK
ncbi:lipoprotein [Herbaspirillum sp. RV1423]|uniref:COG4315 family predicted lipoprotein n=1 Tax=Herbaspirillum sp. RV1423 TaxID=1443993 RepID=UPI0004AEFBC1|nr:lipoprotein [Herbaspirillum sp. RV1423]